MCKVYLISYSCGHKQLFRLSTCRGRYARYSTRPGRTPQAACNAGPSLTFASAMACGDCQKKAFDAVLVAAKEEAELHWLTLTRQSDQAEQRSREDDSRTDAAREAMDAAREICDRETFHSEKKFATGKRLKSYKPLKHRPFKAFRGPSLPKCRDACGPPNDCASGIGEICNGSPLRRELQPEDIKICERAKISSDGWGYIGDAYPEAEDGTANSNGELITSECEISNVDEAGSCNNSEQCEDVLVNRRESGSLKDLCVLVQDEREMVLLEEGRFNTYARTLPTEKALVKTPIEEKGAWSKPKCLQVWAWLTVSS